MTETRTDPDRSRELSQIVGRIAFHLAQAHVVGQAAELRRLRPDDATSAAFHRIAVTFLEGQLSCDLGQERRWAALLAAMATLRGLHAPGRRLGQALVEADVSEPRVVRLLRAHGDPLLDAMRMAVHPLSQRRVAFDQADLAWLVLTDGTEREEDQRRRVARDYFRALRRASTPTEEAAS